MFICLYQQLFHVSYLFYEYLHIHGYYYVCVIQSFCHTVPLYRFVRRDGLSSVYALSQFYPTIMMGPFQEKKFIRKHQSCGQVLGNGVW